MPRTGGNITKAKILEMSEDLFSENGFTGTGIEKIAKAAGINKATLYYHFKDKNDIINTLFETMIDDVDAALSEESRNNTGMGFKEKFNYEVKSFLDKNKILSVLLMESLKSDNTSDYLFEFISKIIKHNYSQKQKKENSEINFESEDFNKYMVYEFFTGMAPVLMYITLKDKYLEYYKMDEDQLYNYFIDSFILSHASEHNLSMDR